VKFWVFGGALGGVWDKNGDTSEIEGCLPSFVFVQGKSRAAEIQGKKNLLEPWRGSTDLDKNVKFVVFCSCQIRRGRKRAYEDQQKMGFNKPFLRNQI